MVSEIEQGKIGGVSTRLTLKLTNQPSYIQQNLLHEQTDRSQHWAIYYHRVDGHSKNHCSTSLGRNWNG
jgi:hypothetical protein